MKRGRKPFNLGGVAALIWALLAFPHPLYAERGPGLPEFSHKTDAYTRRMYSIKLPKGFRDAGASDDELFDGNAAKTLWLWGRVTREKGRWLAEDIEAMQLRAACGGGAWTALRRKVKGRFIEGAVVACGKQRSAEIIDEDFSTGWVKVWLNSRKTNSHYLMDFQTTEAAHEEHVQEAVDRIIYSIEEPKELWLVKPKKKKAGRVSKQEAEEEYEDEEDEDEGGKRWRLRWPKFKKKPAAEDHSGDEPIYLH